MELWFDDPFLKVRFETGDTAAQRSVAVGALMALAAASRRVLESDHTQGLHTLELLPNANVKGCMDRVQSAYEAERTIITVPTADYL